MVSVSMFHVIILYRYKTVKLLESPSRNGLQTRCRSSVDFQIWRPLSTITQDLNEWLATLRTQIHVPDMVFSSVPVRRYRMSKSGNRCGVEHELRSKES